jgi:hypothetical protein
VKTKTGLLNKSEAPPGWSLAHSLADELVAQTVRTQPQERLGIPELIDKVRAAIDRVENDGRVLDFNLPQLRMADEHTILQPCRTRK